MDDARAQIARIVEAHLDEILDRLMLAYDAEIPAVAGAGDAGRATVREAARRTALSFLEVYGKGERPVPVAIEEARRVTVARAGEMFSYDDISSMIRVARNVVYQTARAFVEHDLGMDAAQSEDVRVALESFLSELERSAGILPSDDGAVNDLLSSAESEGPDLG